MGPIKVILVLTLLMFFLHEFSETFNDSKSFIKRLENTNIISSPEPLCSQGELRMAFIPASIVRRCPPFSKIFFHGQSQILYESFIGRGTNVIINNSGHMTKMAAIYGKNPSKIFFSGTGEKISTRLAM